MEAAQAQVVPGASLTSKSLSSLSSASTNSLLSTPCKGQRQGLSTAVAWHSHQGHHEVFLSCSQPAGRSSPAQQHQGWKALPHHHHHHLLPSLPPTRSRSLHPAAAGPCQRRGWGSCKCLHTERKIGIFHKPQEKDGLWAGRAVKTCTGQHQSEVWIKPLPSSEPTLLQS